MVTRLGFWSTLSFGRNMTKTTANLPYVLGSTAAEHTRLMRQAALLDPFTERLFRDAGVGPGQRVLDIGSGLGDVAILAARLVGPSGEVIGVERDANAIAKARARVAAAGLQNVTFMRADVSEVASSKPFDAVVGRFILQFLLDPGSVVRSLSQLVRPGGILAFHEPTWGPFLLLAAYLPLRSACASLIDQAFQRSGANTNMELVLYRTFLEAGLPAPTMRIEIPIGDDPRFARWVYDLLCSVRPRMEQHGIDYDLVGDFETLLQRLAAEASDGKTFGALVGLVGAWSRRPGHQS